MINSKFALPSSAKTFLKKSQSIQEIILAANSPMGAPSPQKVPATAQQIRPPFSPKFMPSNEVSSEAGHACLPTCSPPGSLPHFLNSQQFCLGFIRFFVLCFILVPLFCCELLTTECFRVYHGRIKTSPRPKQGSPARFSTI
jgi:hypothetical protein